MLPPHLPCVCTLRASAPCLYCAGGQALAQPNRLSVLGVAVARPSVRVSGNGGGKRLAGGEGISARLKPRSTGVSVRHAMPRGPTRGIEPRTPTAGAAGADHHREKIAQSPCQAAPPSAALRHFMKTSHPLPQPRASAAIRRRIWSREHRASCGERMRCPSGPRACRSASSATLRCSRLACARLNEGPSSWALGLAGGASFSCVFSRGRLSLQVTYYLARCYVMLCYVMSASIIAFLRP